MKQPNKEDLILKSLYNYKNDASDHSFKLICQSLNIPIDNFWELQEIANRLREDGYINVRFTITDCYAKLTNDGIEYCEGKF